MSTTNGFAVCSDIYQLFPIRWHSFKIATTDSNHGYKTYPNLLAGLTLTGTNQAWVADITYIRILKGFVYLAALLDRYSRKVIGWAISKRIDAELCVAALKSALDKRQPPVGCIHHSDRGVQYACHQYVAMLEGAKMKISMSRAGNPYDVYNKKRLHSALGYLSPEEYEMSIQQTKTADLRPPSNLGENSPAGGRSPIQEHLQDLLEQEVSEWLGREKSERKVNVLEQPGYRNGYAQKPRRFTTSLGTVQIQRPRVRELTRLRGFASRKKVWWSVRSWNCTGWVIEKQRIVL